MKPEHLFLKMKNRLFYLSVILFKRSNLRGEKDTFLLRIMAYYANAHLLNTMSGVKLWASKIDFKYFNALDKATLDTLVNETQELTYFLHLLYTQNKQMKDNDLTLHLRKNNTLPYYNIENISLNADTIENALTQALNDIDFQVYSEETIINFYENINLRKNVWTSYFKCKEIAKTLDLQVLKGSRF